MIMRTTTITIRRSPSYVWFGSFLFIFILGVNCQKLTAQPIYNIDTLLFSSLNSSTIPIIAKRNTIFNHFKTSFYKRKARLLSPDKQKRISVMYYSSNSPFATYIYSNKLMYLASFMFIEEEYYLKYNDLILNCNTELKEIEQFSPKSYAARYSYPLEMLTSIKQPTDSGFHEDFAICIPFEDGNSNLIMLYFYNHRLLLIDLYDSVNFYINPINVNLRPKATFLFDSNL